MSQKSLNLFKIVLVFMVLYVSFNYPNMNAANADTSFYVAPDGNDRNNGTESKPFKTVLKARDEARKSNAEENKKIIVRGGNYYEVEMVLGPEDSGLTIEGYPGEIPILYGGRPVTNWEKDGSFYSAKLAGVKDRAWDFRLLVVNNEMRPRARLPRDGAFIHLNKFFNTRWLSSSGSGWEIDPGEKDLTTMKYNPKDIGPWLDVRNAELTTFNAWDETLVGLKSIDEKTLTVHFSIPAGHPPGSFRFHRMVDGSLCNWQKAQTYIVWNVREGMHESGQWYLDRTNEKLVYWPKPGEDISKLTIVAPTKENVVRFEPGANNITLKDLVITCTTTPLLTGSYGAIAFDGALSGSGIKNCQFINLTVENVSGFGFKLTGDDLNIESCGVQYTGAGGISYTGQGSTIVNNHIHDIGLIYPSGIALRVGGGENRIYHNEVNTTSYIGIRIGGEKNIAENNLIYDVMKELNDGGQFFITGSDNIIRGNFAHEGPGDEEEWTGFFDRGEDRFKWAYYMDENSTNCTFENNLALNTVRPVHMHMTKNCTFRNNVFIDRGIQILSFPRSIGLTYEKNINIADEIIFSNQYDAFNSMPNNIMFSRSGSIIHELIMIYTPIDYRPYKPLEGTVFADPMFVDGKNGNFNFKPDSPAHKKSIIPIDVTSAGLITK
ncbi:right-handed parallel beta-helix repeat-containing protein [Candidatus Latescibacterota bacterium]